MKTAQQDARIDGTNNTLVQVVNGVVHIGARRKLVLTLYENRAAQLAESEAETALLSAYRRDVVKMVGRNGALTSLRAWVDSKPQMSIRVLTGGAGRGKTRLAAEFARSLGKDWLAGFVTGAFDDFCAGGPEEWLRNKPTLVIVDYAASRVAALKTWLGELADSPLQKSPKLRLMLLERQAQREIGWLADLVGRGEGDSEIKAGWLDPAKPEELCPLEGKAHRRAVFATLLARANPALTAPTDAAFDSALEKRKWGGDPLFLMMAALAAGERGVAAALSLSRTELADWAAQRELGRIGRLAAARGIDRDSAPPGRFLRRLAALATLTQGATGGQARALADMEAEALGAPIDRDAAVNALAVALPPAEAGKTVGTILPDIVGEAALLRVFGDDGEGVVGGVDAQSRVLAAARAAVQGASATLVRAAQDFVHAGRLEPVRWLEAWTEAPETELVALMKIANAIPLQSLALRETAARVHRKILDALGALSRVSASPGLTEAIAASLNDLSNRLSEIGRRDDARTTARTAVEIFRRLALPDGNVQLAKALHNLAISSLELNLVDEALAAARESVAAWRVLAAGKDSLSSWLARALNALSNVLGRLGHRREALDAAREAVALSRRLAAPDTSPWLLASLLATLGNRYSEISRPFDTLVAAQEAADIYSRLAAEQPDTFLPQHAMALNNLGNAFGALNRQQPALDAAREALDLYRRLSGRHPDAYLPDLSSALTNYGIRLRALGRSEDALVAGQEAADILRRLAATEPTAFLPKLAAILNNLSNAFVGVGRREEALAAANEAVIIARGLAVVHPLAHQPLLGRFLLTTANCLNDLGRPHEAIAAVREAVASFRSAVAEQQGNFRAELGAALLLFVNTAFSLRVGDDVVAAAREAVELFRGLAAESKEARSARDLAAALVDLGGCGIELGRREIALTAFGEAVELLRSLTRAKADGIAPDMAAALHGWGRALNDVGRNKEALAASKESVKIFRRLAATRPQAFTEQLSRVLTGLGYCWESAGNAKAALDAIRESIALLSPLFLKHSHVYAGRMTWMSQQYLERCERVGQVPDQALLAPVVAALETVKSLEQT